VGGPVSPVEMAVDRVLADPLHAARSRTGAIAYVGVDVPSDLLLATGRVTCHLPWRADRATPVADQWLESGFPGWARSMIEDWAAGQFDCFDQVVFSRGEDSIQRLYYYVCELQKRGALGGPKPIIFDIAKIPRESSRRHTVAAVGKLARQLGIDEAGMLAGIARANGRRKLFDRIDAGRETHGSLYERVARATLFADLDSLLETAAWPTGTVTGRVLLAGSAPPDDRLHLAVERTGWSVTGEMIERSLTRLGPQTQSNFHNAAEAIAHQLLATSLGPRGFGDAAAALVAAARRARADVVLIWLTREEEALSWHVPAQRERLAAAGIAAHFMTSRSWDATDGASDEIHRFLESRRP
jgi:hypothetical protein